MSRSVSASLATAADRVTAMRAQLTAARRELIWLREELAAATAEKEALRRDLQLRNGALDAATSHFMILDVKRPGRPMVYVNRALARDHGYEPAELVGKSVSTLRLKYQSEEQSEQLRRAIDAGQTIHVEAEAARRDGLPFWVGFYAAPLHNAGGEVTHYIAVGADITARLEAERRKRELQEQLHSEFRERERMAIELRLAHKLEAVGRLAAGLAHEINTPIQYVGDSVYFLRSAFDDLAKLFNACRDALNSLPMQVRDESAVRAIAEIEAAIDFDFLKIEVPRAFERTLEGTQRVAGIVRAMKEFAHPDANEHGPADLNHALETTLAVARNEYKYAAAIVTQFGELPPVICNVGELNQVFLNVIVNAAHAIHDAGRDANDGRITVTTRLDGDYAEVMIGDNGCGIPQDILDKIFDPFFTTKEVGRGTGQGLAIARSIVLDRHGGDINVHSEVGIGTRFVLKLPIAGRNAGKAAA